MVVLCCQSILHFKEIRDIGMLEPSKSSLLSSLRTVAITVPATFLKELPVRVHLRLEHRVTTSSMSIIESSCSPIRSAFPSGALLKILVCAIFSYWPWCFLCLQISSSTYTIIIRFSRSGAPLCSSFLPISLKYLSMIPSK